MFLSRSIRRKLLATALSALGFVLLYEASTIDSHTIASLAAQSGVAPRFAAGSQAQFTATAYCKGQTTASGVAVRSGIVAADPNLLPLGSVIRIDDGPERYRGIYTVMDTGPKVQGRHIDVYIWSCYEALDFGRRSLNVTVLRHGYRPNDLARRGN